MMRLQAGGQGYVPGVSGDIWYGGLKGRLSEAGDVIREGAGDVRDYMSQRGLSSMVGGVGGQFAGKQLGKWLLKNALKKTLFATNPLLGLGLEAGLGALGAYAGTRGAGSKGFLSFLGKDEPTIKKTKTGLLSGDIDYLEGIKGDIGEDIKGRATGSAITSLLSSLTSAAAGEAWEGYGKYKSAKDVKDVSGVATQLSEQDIFDTFPEEMKDEYIGWASEPGRVSNRLIKDWYASPEFMESPFAEFATKQAGGSVYENPVSYQEGGYMPEYQMGGSTYQESPSYQLNGLLKYKRNPIVG